MAIGIVLIGELEWLTHGEQRDAREALSSLDSLQDFGAVSDSNFAAGMIQAKARIQHAQESAWTMRDYVVADSLYDYWLETGAFRDETHELNEARHSIPISKWSNGYLLNGPVEAGADSRRAIHLALHQMVN